ncbi:MAG: hypothetical protein ABSH53_13410 [Holophaga sp.]
MNLPSQALPAQALASRRLLFICTGNFFRSAFAEHYFNHLAAENRKLGAQDPRRKPAAWSAEFRGLDLAQLSPSQRAARMSHFALERLRGLGIPVPMAPGAGFPAHSPTPLALADLEQFDRIIAMHAPSHRPMLRAFLERHPGLPRAPGALLDRVEFWHIDDVTAAPGAVLTPEQQAGRSLDEVQEAVEHLFSKL